MRAVLLLFVFVLFFIGIVLLQLYLSMRTNKWLGLIIPCLCLLFSILILFNLAMYTVVGTSKVSVVTEENGVVIEEGSSLKDLNRPAVGEILATAVPVFIITNIPTLVFLAIYWGAREKFTKKIQLEKMNIQDLE